jgi:hypothetical protein
MPLLRLDEDPGQIVLHTQGAVCTTTRELAESDAFERVVGLFVAYLQAHDMPLLQAVGFDGDDPAQRAALVDLLRLLAHNPLERVTRGRADREALLARREALHEFVEGLYDFWRRFDRFMIDHAVASPGGRRGQVYRTFSATAEALAELVRDLYRDVAENITATHPRVYRQVHAGVEMGVIVAPRAWPMPVDYRGQLDGIPFVRRVLMYPPLVLDPPTNTRSGSFLEVGENPLAGMTFERERWLCYPAVVGRLVVFVYFHQRFLGLGLSLANLFEMATDEQIAAGPDAVYVYGAPPEALARFGEQPTVFFDDQASGLLVGAVPLDDRYGYFGYLKKMILTLHNVAVLKRGLMPFHGAYTRIVLQSGEAANVLIIGDTATGKSETLEALRMVGERQIAELRLIADDMGSLDVGADGRLLGYGTEIGAFVRLDDLQQGYALGQIDRAIIMSPHKVNARVVLPVTTLDEVLRGYPVDFLLYANNYDEPANEGLFVERFADAGAALAVFREGRAMSKGTTTSTGLVASYFANIFGAAQRREQHEVIAERIFAAAFEAGVFVGQLRTRLGMPGHETEGPRSAAQALLAVIATAKKGEPPS